MCSLFKTKPTVRLLQFSVVAANLVAKLLSSEIAKLYISPLLIWNNTEMYTIFSYWEVDIIVLKIHSCQRVVCMQPPVLLIKYRYMYCQFSVLRSADRKLKIRNYYECIREIRDYYKCIRDNPQIFTYTFIIVPFQKEYFRLMRTF